MPGVTAPPTFSADGLSPSTTYTVFAVDTRGWTLIINSWVILSFVSFFVSNTGSLSNGLSTISYPIDFNTSIWVCTSLSGIVSPDLPVKVNAWSVNSVSVWVFGSAEINLTFAFWSSFSYVILIFAFGSVIFGGLYPCSGFAGFTGSNGVPFPSFGV